MGDSEDYPVEDDDYPIDSNHVEEDDDDRNSDVNGPFERTNEEGIVVPEDHIY